MGAFLEINITDEFSKLSDEDKKEFSKVVMNFINSGVMLEKLYNRNEKRLRTNRDYRFIEYNLDLVRTYLSMLDIEIIEDRSKGMMITRGQHMSYLQLDIIETIFLLLLRIIYDEKHEEASLNSEIYFKLSELLHKGSVLGVINSNPPAVKIEKALKVFSKHKIICKIKGYYTDIDSSYLLYPTITSLVNNQNILAIINEYAENKNQEELNNYFNGDIQSNEEIEESEDN